MDIKSIIQKSKIKGTDSTLKLLTNDAVENLVSKMWKEMEGEIVAEIKSIVEEAIRKLVKDVRKGDKGDKPVLGIDYQLPRDGRDGENGKDADEERIIDEVVKIISKKIQVKDGKDAVVDYPYIVSQVEKYIKIPENKTDSPEQIANKLNTLEEKVEISVIKGLKKRLENISKKPVSGGGGMGNIQHESKSISSASTYVDANYNIAGSGYALWVYYQGQMVARGVGYTVSGKRITLLFTPQDSTFLDIIYIRT